MAAQDGTPGLWLRLLGPMSVCRDGADVPIPAAKQRAVLGMLAVRAGTVVSFEELAETVWDGAPPAAARSTLRAYVKRLRQLLGPALAGRLVTRQPGYLLAAGQDELDLLVFDRACAGAAAAVQAGEWPRAARLLAGALGLWRGEPLVDIPSESLRREALPRLEAQWLQATGWHVEARLALGLHAQLVAELTTLVGAHPLRERFRAQLMLALYRCGRPGDALAAYRQARSTLIEQLGVEPGSELRALHQRILAADPALDAPRPDGPVPRQLPTDLATFTGRTAALADLDRLLTAAGDRPTAVVISAVSGTAGVGKTTLAVHWAHRVAARFPDGQLYANLRGFDPGGQVVASAAAVRGFLAALGVPAERVPAQLDAQVGLYRSLLAGRRVLVLLDNARDAEQVRPLLPGTGTALAVVTSRDCLAELVAADGAHPLALDLPTQAEARELLERRLGPDRVATEPAAVEQIIRASGRLPLALALVAARAATHRTFPLTALAGELAAAGEGRPDTGEVLTQVRAVLSWSYTTLTPAAGRLFRLLGLHPGPDTTAPAAASLAGLPPAQVRPLLVELTRAGLLAETAPGRYGCHDLLRAYATHLTGSHDPAPEREAAVVRLLDHYTHTAHTAAGHLYPTGDPIQVPLTPPAPGTTAERLADRPAALGWLDAERPVLLAVQQLAAGDGRDTHAWQLAWALDTALNRRGYWREMVGAWHTALPAAERLPHPAAAYAHRRLGQAVTMLGEDEQALTYLRRALRLHTEAADPVGQAHTHRTLALLREQRGRPDRALDHARQALDLYRTAGHRRGEAAALNAVGWYHALLGDHADTLTHCRQALTLHQQLGHRVGEADTWDSLGYAHHHLAQFTQAVNCYQHALVLARDLGDRYHQATVLTHLGDTHHAAGHTDQARTALTAALDILTDLDHPEADTVRTRLATLDQPTRHHR